MNPNIAAYMGIAEYEPDEEVTHDDTQKAIEVAAEFLLQVGAYLRENGFYSSEPL